MPTLSNARPPFDVGGVLRSHGQAYERAHPMTAEQRRALRAAAVCRTAWLGGHLERCGSCGFERPSYNSCRNSNCPKCQGTERRQWVERRLDDLLPVPHFHVVFTLPSEFRGEFMTDPRRLLGLLFRASSRTLLSFFADKHDVEPALTGVLHTWGSAMGLHPHVHYLVTGGGLSRSGDGWVSLGRNWLFDVAELSAEFRRRFVRSCPRSGIRVPDGVADRDWVVHVKKPFAGAETVVKYLGRYAYRTAVSDRRILDVSDGEVSLEVKDYRNLDADGAPARATVSLDAVEFVRRFLQHVLPSNFRKTRLFGVLAGTRRAEKLERCRASLAEAQAEESAEEPPPSDVEELPDPLLCPKCGTGAMLVVETLEAIRPPPVTFANEEGRHAA